MTSIDGDEREKNHRRKHQPNQTKPPLLTVSIIGTMERSRSTSSRFHRLPQQPESDCMGHRLRHPWFPLFEGRIFDVVSVIVVIAAAVVIVDFGGDGSGTNADVTAGVFAEALSTPSSYDVSSDYVTTEMVPTFLIPPRKTRNDGQRTSNITLREFLIHPDGFHLGMAPSFFGFYGM